MWENRQNVNGEMSLSAQFVSLQSNCGKIQNIVLTPDKVLMKCSTLENV